jgi:hypothetical protein
MNVLLKFFAAGSYAIIYIYANELFPTGIRNTGMGICSMVASNIYLFINPMRINESLFLSIGIGAIVGTTSNDMLVSMSIVSGHVFTLRMLRANSKKEYELCLSFSD